MDEKPINSSNNTNNNNSSPVKKPDDAAKNSLRTGGPANIVRVPKQQAVVSPIKPRVGVDKKTPRNLKELKKQKAKEEKQRLKEEKQQQKQEIQKQKQEKQQQVVVEKKKEVKETKTKAQKQQEKLQRKKDKIAEQERAKIKDFNLDNLTALENIVLRRIEEKEEKKRKKIIVLLMIFLITMITIGSCTAVGIIEEHRPKPIAVDISVEAGWLDRELLDPNNPSAGFKTIVLYPGDTVRVNFSVSNVVVTQDFPVFLRFRAYIVLNSLTEHHVFIPTFKDPEMWYSRDESSNGVQIDDWFYYGDLLKTGYENKLQILEAIKLTPNLGNEFQGKDFTLVLAVEVVEGDVEAIKSFESWWLAPEAWFDLMGITLDD